MDFWTPTLSWILFEYVDYYPRTDFLTTPLQRWRTRNQSWLNYF